MSDNARLPQAGGGTTTGRFILLTLAVAIPVAVGHYVLGPLLYMALVPTTVILVVAGRGPKGRVPVRIRFLALGALAVGICGVGLLTSANRIAAPELVFLGYSVPENLAGIGLFLAFLALADRKVSAPQARVPLSAWVAIPLCALAYLGSVFAARWTTDEMGAGCSANVCTIASAMHAYLADHGGTYPPCDQYPAALERYMTGPFPQCPATHGSYAYNAALAGLPADKLSTPGWTVVIFESRNRSPACGGPELLPDAPSHLKGDLYAFADGLVTWRARTRLPDGTWAKEPVADRERWEPVLKESEGEEHPP